jgi:hypothetical protein
MQFQFDVTQVPGVELPKPPAPAAPSAPVELLRQLVEVQREQLELMKANQANLAAMAEAQSKKRSWFDRWQSEFPDLPDACRQSVPFLERSYLTLIARLTEELHENEDAFESEFALRDFLDRYGFPLVHLGGILQAVAQLTDVNTVSEAE